MGKEHKLSAGISGIFFFVCFLTLLSIFPKQKSLPIARCQVEIGSDPPEAF